jgi:hypothetical protein
MGVLPTYEEMVGELKAKREKEEHERRMKALLGEWERKLDEVLPAEKEDSP